MKYDYAIVMGRFQPLHKGHLDLINKALEIAENVIISIGSVNQPRSPRNPFTYEERMNMIISSVPEEQRLSFVGIRDYPYSEETWEEEVRNKVTTITGHSAKIALVGCFKEGDQSTYYLNSFPQWKLETIYQKEDFNSTVIRENYFLRGMVTTNTSKQVSEFLTLFKDRTAYKNLREDFNILQTYKPKNTIATDAVVMHKGHVLLVERGRYGKGQWALVGGILEQNLTLEDNLFKELYEETEIVCPREDFKIEEIRIFDSPSRSYRNRVVSVAYRLSINDNHPTLPKVNGGDDAQRAFWISIPEALENEDKFFEDHIHLLRSFV